ncbi:RagB/SusD family nutrient uptake outer membrane protein [Sphingobacterium mizutaii]|uniref:RagB/SusD family nutrient uptake outer membrane protein n=1 Tax=Sphingobacterium mizutaii TaxID=1010 RepID=UPI001629D058|nr:RagB/SusD family nutrient uptake outer membrane protein [Sphingobacterium mizutaii]
MNIKFLPIIALLAFSFFGCKKDFLETRSTETVDEEAIFSNTKTAMMAVNGLHKLMWTPDLSSTAFYGGYDMLMIWYDVMGEDLVYTYSNAQFQTQAQWATHRKPTVGSVEHFYRLMQYFVSNANMIIDRIDQIEGPQNEKNNIKGQAMFYRAFANFTMVQMYGKRYLPGKDNNQMGIVLRNDNSTEPRARASVEEVYVAINSDIDESIKLLEATDIKRSTKAHINVHVARGLKARILLVQGHWLEAAKMAEQVVKNSGAKLQEDTYKTLDNRFSDQSNNEWLWGSKPLLSQGKNLTHFHGYMSNENISYNQNSPRAIYNLLYDKISETDVRKSIWFPKAVDRLVTPRPLVPPSTNSKYANYMANKFLVSDPQTTGERDIPFMRLPEMMLIAAEGYARAGGHDVQATESLYPLAVHRDPQYQKSQNTGETLIEEILFQRRVELWGEGFRYLDLKRLNLPLDRGPKPRSGYNQGNWSNSLTSMPTNLDPLASNFNMYGNGTVIGDPNRYRSVDSKDWEWVLPEKEVELNPLCIQNPL